jgi:sugar lactone lactonase YvrE
MARMKAPAGMKAPRMIAPTREPATKPPGLTGAWAPGDNRLDAVERFPLPSGHGPEDVCVDLEGNLVAGGEDGNIWRWPAGAQPGDLPEKVANTGGRPLGIEVDPRDGSLIVCDAYKGLLRIRDGQAQTLTAEAGGKPIGFCNNASIATDGAIYFTDSSSRFPLFAWRRDILEHRPNGRLLAYRDGSTEVLLEGLYFPNGVALTPDESTLLFVEDSTHRLSRFTLATGKCEVLLDLAAYPDNMAGTGDGAFWIAMPSPRLPIVERLLPHPFLRKAADLLPQRMQPQPERYGLVALVTADGTIRRTLHGPAGSYSMITGVRQQGQSLWLGSLTENAVGRINLS